MKVKNTKYLLFSFIIWMMSYAPRARAQVSPKIVSVNGTVSEILAGIGMESNIIGTDITSNYPASLKSKPKVGHNRNLSAEGILTLQPDVVTGLSSELKPELVSQLKSAGIKLVLFTQIYSADGTRKLIKEVAAAFGRPQKADPLIKQLNSDLAAAAKVKKVGKPKVLFIYARGTGTMMVAGEGTQMQQIIEMAGGINAVTGFKDFKPLTPEALVAANPDVILLFSSGMDSLGGAMGLLNVQGVAQTNAGKNKRFITMDGELVSSFGPRLGLAVGELAQKIN
ncbi:heme/hemin ABC transporter substrate-binding protein [Mucilaginibacter sp. KACC 22063]|uniref:heme/hemin ABC transporter substrate-binding protein n=1 Tax=Mucilaginibacter sp. KACC 22063 TaxID=3025666 RepID=UPI00236720D2|nr:ABC transporter substrate-binding protein [Mucilaginibacter sp. KACC 22063]WDF54254.1 ABC transporter substrate-binding protein [Mucilaginibacter sp. KACC 22063]